MTTVANQTAPPLRSIAAQAFATFLAFLNAFLGAALLIGVFLAAINAVLSLFDASPLEAAGLSHWLLLAVLYLLFRQWQRDQRDGRAGEVRVVQHVTAQQDALDARIISVIANAMQSGRLPGLER